MTSRWSREDRAAWDGSEVVQELEKKVLRVISSLDNILKNSGAIEDLNDVGSSAPGIQNAANAVGNLATSVENLNQASEADDAPSLQALGEGLVAAYNTILKEQNPAADALVHDDLMYFDEKFDLNDEGGLLWAVASEHVGIGNAYDKLKGDDRVDLLTIEGRLKVVALATSVMAHKKARSESPDGSSDSHNKRRDEIMSGLGIDYNYIKSLASSTSLATSEQVEDETPPQPEEKTSDTPSEVSNEVDDKLSVVARLRGLLKEATDKREIKLAYKIERTIDEILEEG